jgi:hypothetical protein
MLVFYRGHIIFLLRDLVISAEVTEHASGAPLPTKVSAGLFDSEGQIVARAKALVDIYMD